MGDRSQKEILELFIQNLLMDLRKKYSTILHELQAEEMKAFQMGGLVCGQPMSMAEPDPGAANKMKKALIMSQIESMVATVSFPTLI